MIDSDLCSVHLHLYYKEPSMYIIDRLSKVWNGKVYISMLKNCENNEDILAKCQKAFSQTVWCEVENKGTDQYGFFYSNRMNEEKYKPWVLYIHDKSEDKMEWLSDMIEIFVEDEYQTVLDRYMNSKKTGIIGCKSRKMKLLDSDELIQIHQHTPLTNRNLFVKSVATLAWMRELQNIFYNKSGIVEEKVLNPYFVAGTVFMARKLIINQCHGCVHDNFFENGYRSDGEVEHALERFYAYVSEALGYNNIFI